MNTFNTPKKLSFWIMSAGLILMLGVLLNTGNLPTKVSAHGGDATLLHLCANNNSGSLKRVDPNDNCNNNEMMIHLSLDENDEDEVIGNEVLDAANATLIRSGGGTSASPFKLAVNLANANIWTALQRFTAGIEITNLLDIDGSNFFDGGCTDNQHVIGISSAGTVSCGDDSGDIAGVIAGTGLTGGGINGTVTLNADTSFLQRRVSSSCPAGQSIRAVNSDGTVVCEPDDVGAVGGCSQIASKSGGGSVASSVLPSACFFPGTCQLVIAYDRGDPNLPPSTTFAWYTQHSATNRWQATGINNGFATDILGQQTEIAVTTGSNSGNGGGVSFLPPLDPFTERIIQANVGNTPFAVLEDDRTGVETSSNQLTLSISAVGAINPSATAYVCR